MMHSEFEAQIREIKRLYLLISNKDSDVYCVFKGTSLGIVKCWNIKIDNREANGEKLVDAVAELLASLKLELANKISRLENEALQLRGALSGSNN
jgi:hypothetical protein